MSLTKCDPEEFQAIAEREEVIEHYECVRGYVCENCEDRFAEIGKRNGYKFKKKCPSCKKLTLDSLIMGDVRAFVKEITTVGQLAEKDNKKLGKYGVEDKIREIKEQKKAAQAEVARRSGRDLSRVVETKEDQKTWYNPNGDNLSHLADLSPKAQEKYIETGIVDKNA